MKMVMVSSKEYNDLVTRCNILESELAERNMQATRLLRQKKELEDEVVRLNIRVVDLVDDTDRASETIEDLKNKINVRENQRDSWSREAKRQSDKFEAAVNSLNAEIEKNKELQKKLDKANETIGCMKVAEEIGRALHAMDKTKPTEIQKAWELLHKMYNIDQCIDYNEELEVNEFNVYFNSKNFCRKMEGVADELMAAGINGVELLGDSREGYVIVRESK